VGLQGLRCFLRLRGNLRKIKVLKMLEPYYLFLAQKGRSAEGVEEFRENCVGFFLVGITPYCFEIRAFVGIASAEQCGQFPGLVLYG